ncbi:MAG: serine/threonine-protein kinase [Pirellulales bacterium]
MSESDSTSRPRAAEDHAQSDGDHVDGPGQSASQRDAAAEAPSEDAADRIAAQSENDLSEPPQRDDAGDPFVQESDRTIISSSPPMESAARRYHPLELARILEGERLGHFQLQGFIGGGGMGAVFRALDTMLDRTVAVKVLATDQSADDETQRRFKNEAQSAARLDHENIARVYYVGEDRGVHYIVFEFIDGINIRELVDQHGPLSLADAINYTMQICQALAHASERDVVHRDIKPSNVLITPRGRAKLVDMGLARLYQVDRTQADLTASGVTLGTFDYISPEQARDPRSADVRSDIYSLGCTLFYMLTGQPPFPEGTVLQKLLQHQGDNAPDPRDFRPELPEEVSRVAARMLAKSPDDRYQTPQEVIAEFLWLSERLGIALPSSENTLWVTQQEDASSFIRGHLPWMVPALLLAVAVIVLDRYWFDAPSVAELPPITSVAAPSSPIEQADSNDADAAVPSDLQGSPPAPGQPGEGTETLELSPSQQNGGEGSTAPATSDSVALTNPMTRRLRGNQGESLRLPVSEAGVSASTTSGYGITVPPDPETARIDRNRPPVATDSPDRPSTTASDPRGSAIVVVDADDETIAYDSLRAACSEAKSGQVIELRYDGQREEEPIKLMNQRVTIRAGANRQTGALYRPEIVFRPEARSGTVDKNPINLIGGELTLINVDLRLELPDESNLGSRWSLIEMRGAESVKLESCWLTVVSPPAVQGGQAAAAMFQVTAAPGGESMMIDDPPDSRAAVRITMDDCIARGDAALVFSEESQPLSLTWKNGLLAITDRLLHLTSGPASARLAGEVSVELQHVTAITRSGLILVTNLADAPQVPLDVTCRDSLFVVEPSDALIEHVYSSSEQSFEDSKLTWRGNNNYYDFQGGIELFWWLYSSSDDDPQRMDAQLWQAHWLSDETMSKASSVQWRSAPPQGHPMHQHAPADYLLKQAADNPASTGASDGRSVGFRTDDLPGLVAPSNRLAREPRS